MRFVSIIIEKVTIITNGKNCAYTFGREMKGILKLIFIRSVIVDDINDVNRYYTRSY